LGPSKKSFADLHLAVASRLDEHFVPAGCAAKGRTAVSGPSTGLLHHRELRNLQYRDRPAAKTIPIDQKERQVYPAPGLRWDEID